MKILIAAMFEIAINESLVDSLGEDIDDTLIGTDRRKAIRQAARSVLPNATETKIFVTANVRAWRHFIEMRGAKFADREIRELAIKVLDILRGEVPLLFDDFRVETLEDGSQIATPEYSKA